MNLPSGTITFLFTDIEGSTRLWEEYAEAMRPALARHDALMRQAIEQYEGHVFKTVGDAFCAAFHTAPDALQAALSAHLLLGNEEWGETGPLRVRMALHTGTAEERDGDYFGQTLNRVARLQAVGHGQQTLLSHTTYHLVCHSLPTEVTLTDMGRHRLKDLLAPEQVWQLLHPALPSEFPPLKSLDYLPTNLPRQVTSFIGREQEMEQVKRLLPSTSLLTLLGTGGAGKTRLALQVGAEVLDHYKDGVWLVELAALTNPDFLAQTAAGALGLREESGLSLLATLQDYLRDRQLLMILDNCEHLVEACARMAQTLLTTCSGLTILATSREPLGIAGEHPWRVPSLLTPAPDDLPMEEKDIAAVLMEYDACRLFVERAVVQRQDFVLTRSNVPVVARLCRQLDGIPLAIELAAARVRALSVEEINNRLDQRFRLLTGGSRTALPRQQTLRALIDWSYDLLTPQEKTLLCRVSVFAGGWTLETAEKVGTEESANGVSIEDWEVLDLLTSLSDKSLVIAESSGETTRYRLLETVRQYARERLAESGEGSAIRLRHRDCFLALAEEADLKLSGPEQEEWFQRLEAEHENLRAALDWSLREEGGAGEALRLSGALQCFWWTQGHLAVGRQCCVRALAKAGDQDRTKECAYVLNGGGVLAWMQSDHASARAYFEESLTIRREIGDRSSISSSLNNLGIVAHDQGEYASSRAYFEESLTIGREIGDQGSIAHSLNNLGNVAHDQGEYAASWAYFDESLTISREVGDQGNIAHSLNNLGNAARNQGGSASARTYFEESLALFREVGDRRGLTISLNNLGNVAHDQGEYASSRAYFEESLTIGREIGGQSSIAYSLDGLGMVASAQSDYASARSYFEESLIIRREIRDRKGIADSLEGFAGLAAKEGKWEQAADLYGAVEQLREEIGAPLPHHQREKYDLQVARVRQELGEEAFSSSRTRGYSMTQEQAMEYALETTEG